MLVAARTAETLSADSEPGVSHRVAWAAGSASSERREACACVLTSPDPLGPGLSQVVWCASCVHSRLMRGEDMRGQAKALLSQLSSRARRRQRASAWRQRAQARRWGAQGEADDAGPGSGPEERCSAAAAVCALSEDHALRGRADEAAAAAGLAASLAVREEAATDSLVGGGAARGGDGGHAPALLLLRIAMAEHVAAGMRAGPGLAGTVSAGDALASLASASGLHHAAATAAAALPLLSRSRADDPAASRRAARRSLERLASLLRARAPPGPHPWSDRWVVPASSGAARTSGAWWGAVATLGPLGDVEAAVSALGPAEASPLRSPADGAVRAALAPSPTAQRALRGDLAGLGRLAALIDALPAECRRGASSEAVAGLVAAALDGSTTVDAAALLSLLAGLRQQGTPYAVGAALGAIAGPRGAGTDELVLAASAAVLADSQPSAANARAAARLAAWAVRHAGPDVTARASAASLAAATRRASGSDSGTQLELLDCLEAASAPLGAHTGPVAAAEPLLLDGVCRAVELLCRQGVVSGEAAAQLLRPWLAVASPGTPPRAWTLGAVAMAEQGDLGGAVALLLGLFGQKPRRWRPRQFEDEALPWGTPGASPVTASLEAAASILEAAGAQCPADSPPADAETMAWLRAAGQLVSCPLAEGVSDWGSAGAAEWRHGRWVRHADPPASLRRGAEARLRIGARGLLACRALLPRAPASREQELAAVRTRLLGAVESGLAHAAAAVRWGAESEERRSGWRDLHRASAGFGEDDPVDEDAALAAGSDRGAPPWPAPRLLLPSLRGPVAASSGDGARAVRAGLGLSLVSPTSAQELEGATGSANTALRALLLAAATPTPSDQAASAMARELCTSGRGLRMPLAPLVDAAATAAAVALGCIGPDDPEAATVIIDRAIALAELVASRGAGLGARDAEPWARLLAAAGAARSLALARAAAAALMECDAEGPRA